MEAPSLIGMGVGFAAIGLIFGLLMRKKPDFGLFQKYTPQQFSRTEGMLSMFMIFGLLLILEGAILLLGVIEGENPAAAMMGWGAGLAIFGLVFGLLSIYKPNLGIFKRYEGKKLWQAQGVFMTAAAFGLIFFLLGLAGKPWAV